jgi:acyl-CoA synthetase (AMP-forming)/AMP-acid ligase II/acyl carrier protein
MWRAYPFGPGEVVCQKTALSFVDSIWEVFSGLLCGVRTVVLPDTTVKDPRKLVDALAAEGVSRIVIVPSLLRALLASGIDLAGELPRLRYWTVSGEAFPYDLYENFRQELPEATILNLYGSSEVAADVLCCDLGAIQMNSRTVPIGRPIANTAAYVLDRHANLVPAWVTGELYIGGAGLARGYHHRPELSAQSFVANPFADAPDRLLFKTGDKVRYRPDGQLEYLGRMDYQVKVRGYRIELGEIEMTLAALPQVREAVATVVQSGDDARLVAYVVPRTIAEASAAADSGAELTSRWRTVWDETYLNSADGDGSFNTVGWNSSFDGAPIPESEMREWVDQTVERVLSFAPRRVLEIGCGTGLILLRVAEHCEEYVATDFSRIALDHVRGEIAKLPERYAHVALFEREATDMDGLGDAFDLVILNSVIQYFPSVSYLRQVLRGAIGLTGPTGAVFVGDVRSSTLLKAFHASVELYRAADALRTDILRARIEKQMAHEEELVIAPTLFHEFAPDISQVTVDLKRGSSLNEVIQFRYDVALRRAAAALSPELWLDWNANALTQASVRAHLSDERPDSIGIAGIPNARIVAAMKAVDLLNGGLIETAGELRRVIDEQGRGGVDPEAMWVLGRELGYSVSVGWLVPGDGGRFDVVFRRGGSFGFPSACRHPAGDEEPRVADPLTTVFTQNLVAELRAWLQEKLPDHMVPSTILLLDRLPQTPNGKVDRGALPVPDTVRDGLPGAYEAPCGRTEKLLAAIWADVLNVDRVGVNDNFFEIGGHSLLAMQLVSRIRVELGNEMPVRAIFEAPTIATLAAKLDRETSSGGRALEPGIERVSRRVVKVVRPDGQINRLP